MIDRQRVRIGRKFAQVSEGAKEIFLRDGFSGTSVDDIAAAARVSKATLYSYFADKRLMFEEAMQNERQRLEDAILFDIPADAAPAQAIPALTRQIAEWLVAPDSVRLYRVHVAEAARFPDVARNYHAALHKVLRDRLRERLDHWVARGELRIEDTTLAAEQLVRLAGAEIHDMATLDGGHAPDHDQIARIADSAAQLFLKAHGASGRNEQSLGAAR